MSGAVERALDRVGETSRDLSNAGHDARLAGQSASSAAHAFLAATADRPEEPRYGYFSSGQPDEDPYGYEAQRRRGTDVSREGRSAASSLGSARSSIDAVESRFSALDNVPDDLFEVGNALRSLPPQPPDYDAMLLEVVGHVRAAHRHADRSRSDAGDVSSTRETALNRISDAESYAYAVSRDDEETDSRSPASDCYSAANDVAAAALRLERAIDQLDSGSLRDLQQSLQQVQQLTGALRRMIPS